MTQKLHVKPNYDIIVLGSGWKSISMVDVHGSVTFTLWFCGCNLRCPFCHNWRLAVNDKNYCNKLDLRALYGDLESAKPFVDYLHVTGGEPLLQFQSLTKLFEIVKHNYGLKNSLNSNLTLYKPLKKIVGLNLVDHVATDLKVPFNTLIGYPKSIADKLWGFYKKSLELIIDHGILLELRVPVPHRIYREGYDEALEIITMLSRYDNFYVVIQPLLGYPITNPRDQDWCSEYCNPLREELYRVAEWFKSNGILKVYVKEPVENTI